MVSPPPALSEALETECHNELLKDSGRPAYPISCMGEVFKDTRAYHKRLLPWVKNPRDPDDYRRVFSRQRDRWLEFRKWQLDNRRAAISDDEEGFSVFLQAKQHEFAVIGAAEVTTQPGFEEAMWTQWEQEQQVRQWQRDNVREVQGGFTEYAERAARRLAGHGFTKSFQLEEDPREQDEWTTWVEYLEFEYWWFDKHTQAVQRLQRQHDEAWEKLQKANVLKEFETEESLLTEEAERQRESEQTNRAMQSGASADELLAATARRNELINQFIQGTQPHRIARENARRHDLWIQWIKGQLFQIETGLSQLKANIGKRRRLDDDDEGTPRERAVKKQKQGQEDKGLQKISRRVTGATQGHINGTAADVKAPLQENKGARRTTGRVTRATEGRDDNANHIETPQQEPVVRHEELGAQTLEQADSSSTSDPQKPRRSTRIAKAEEACKLKASSGGSTAPATAEEPKKVQSRPRRKTPRGSTSRSTRSKTQDRLMATTSRVMKRKGGRRSRPTRSGSKG